MKGTLKLTPIGRIIEGMQVVYEGKIVIVKEVSKNQPFFWGLYPPNSDRVSQIVIEYETYDFLEKGTGRAIIHSLPLHPDDWTEALKNIGKEMEFEEDLQTKEVGRI